MVRAEHDCATVTASDPLHLMRGGGDRCGNCALRGAVGHNLDDRRCSNACHWVANSLSSLGCITYLSLPVEHRPSMTPRHRTLFWGRYHGGRPPSSDDSFHSPTVIPPSALDKPNIMKRYHCRRTCSHTSPRRSPTMVTLHDTLFVECRW